MDLPAGLIWPRVRLGGEAVRLLDAIKPLESWRGVLRICGGPGSGKTTALNLLRQAWAEYGDRVTFIDGNEPPPQPAATGAAHWTVMTSDRAELSADTSLVLRLAPWTDDDVIEYVLATRRASAKPLLGRVLAQQERAVLGGNPQLWAAVLEAMTNEPLLTDMNEILCLAVLVGCDAAEVEHCCAIALERVRSFGVVGCGLPAQAHLRHDQVVVNLAARGFVQALGRLETPPPLAARSWRPLLKTAAALLTSRPIALKHLAKLVDRKKLDDQAVAVSLLHAAKAGWRPRPRARLRLTAPLLPGVDWSDTRRIRIAALRGTFARANLSSINLGESRFMGTNLSGAVLRAVQAKGIRLTNVDLNGADLCDAVLTKGSLSDVDMTDARADGICLRLAQIDRLRTAGARFVRADFKWAEVADVDWSEADISGSSFEFANLVRCSLRKGAASGITLRDASLHTCDLQELDVAAPDWAGVKLRNCDLTASVLPNACLRDARFAECGLADVQWEHADLRDAKFSRCTFHMGSSRSGLLVSPIASEGSRTGFYTDDLADWTHKRPEEVRKANLCFADLRGADVLGLDFYLVDLRRARYEQRQLEWFRKCGAILA